MKTLLLTIGVLLTGTIYGQNCDCSELLKYGIYNHFNSNDNIQNFNKIQTAMSDSYIKTDSKGGDGSVGFKGISGSYSKSESEMLQKITSNSFLSESDKDVLKTQSASYVSSEMMNAYRECLRLCEDKGLESKSDFPTDGRFSSISFTLKYQNPPYIERNPILKSIIINPVDCFTCKGDLIDLAKNGLKLETGRLYKMTCIRKIDLIPSVLAGTTKNVYSTDAHISIQTDMGDYDLRIPPLFAKNPEFEKGVGEIIVSLMAKEKFIESYGNNWMLADGSEAPIGSAYRRYIEKYLPHMEGKVPNLCGVFLRGYNNGQNRNPDDKLLGELQSDGIISHSHSVSKIFKSYGHHGGGQQDGTRGGVVHWGTGEYKNEDNVKENENGLNETRPKNVTVNYFIKIN